MAGHTPGPWDAAIVGTYMEVQPTEECGPAIVAWPGFDDADRPLEEHKANCRLLAAAPELLAACKAALAALDGLSGALCSAPDHDVSAAAGAELVRQQLVAALKKARGD